MQKRKDYLEEDEDHLVDKKPKKNTYKGKRKRPPQRIDPNNWEEWEEDEFVDMEQR